MALWRQNMALYADFSFLSNKKPFGGSISVVHPMKYKVLWLEALFSCGMGKQNSNKLTFFSEVFDCFFNISSLALLKVLIRFYIYRMVKAF